jgi:large subunit ribosomal protein L19e
MTATTVKRLAADILKVGRNRIRIKEGEYTRAMEALTREDVKGLIADGAVYSMRYVGHRTKPKRKRKGPGKRRGKKYSRKGKKEAWMERIRAQRKYLEEMLKGGEVPAEYKRKVYLKIKGGSFKGKNALLNYLRENEMYVEKTKADVKAEKKPVPKKAVKKEAPAKKPATEKPVKKE